MKQILFRWETKKWRQRKGYTKTLCVFNLSNWTHGRNSDHPQWVSRGTLIFHASSSSCGRAAAFAVSSVLSIQTHASGALSCPGSSSSPHPRVRVQLPWTSSNRGEDRTSPPGLWEFLGGTPADPRALPTCLCFSGALPTTWPSTPAAYMSIFLNSSACFSSQTWVQGLQLWDGPAQGQAPEGDGARSPCWKGWDWDS